MPTEIKAAFIGFCGTIIAAVIAFVSVIITLKCKKRMKLSTEQSFARFLTQKDCLKEIIANVESISAYTIILRRFQIGSTICKNFLKVMQIN